MTSKVEQAMKRAAKLQQRELTADTGEIERDAASATEGTSWLARDAPASSGTPTDPVKWITPGG
jgi:hypothetical protein